MADNPTTSPAKTSSYPQFAWWGSKNHRIFTISVFVILASLDNTARGVLPPLYAVIGRDFAVSDGALGAITALTTLVVAGAAVVWGYWGDRRTRKPLLLVGTLIWVVGMLLSGLSATYLQLLLFQTITALGVGCIASVGFSVISDFISPHKRGFALSFWGLAQGGGAGAGAIIGGTLGAYNWPLPFFIVAGAGVCFALLYLFTFEPDRGQAEPELAPLFRAGQTYRHHIQWADLRQILTIPTNRWLLLEAFIGPVGYGSWFWLSRLFIARLEATGHTLETATVTGNLLSLLFQTGFYFAVLGGYLGDRWQRRNPAGRAWICTIGIIGAIPFQIAVYFIPLRGLHFAEESSLIQLVLAVLLSLVTNPWVATTFVVAIFALALSSLDLPNRTALFTDVNLPEHRGPIAGLITIVAGSGLALGGWLSGLTVTYLQAHLPPPLNYATGLSLFQIFLIPAGFCYYQVTKTAGADIRRMRQILTERAKG